MSAQLAAAAAPSNVFSAHLQLADGATASIHAPTLTGLSAIVSMLTAANDAVQVAGSMKPAATPRGQTAQHAAADHIPGEKNRDGEVGNASASTATPASAPAASGGSAASADAPKYTYDDIAARVKELCKKPGGRDKCVALLKTFKAVSGQPVDHGNKLQLADYASFISQADAILGAAA